MKREQGGETPNLSHYNSNEIVECKKKENEKEKKCLRLLQKKKFRIKNKTLFNSC